MKKRKINGRGIVTVVVLVFLGLFSVLNIKSATGPAKEFLKKELSFKEFTKEVQSGYTSDEFTGKTAFLNLNGLFARIIGQRVCNEVVLLDNGMLATPAKRVDMTKQGEALVSLAEYAKELEIPFLYVQAPYKEDKEDSLYPVGVESFANENSDDLLGMLTENQVETLDLRPYLSETPELIEQYYYRTDHHWNAAGAFVGFQKIAERLAGMFPEKALDLTYTQWEQWEHHTLRDWMLGSRGKRVGRWFGGTEDLTWYTPRFETEMSGTVTKHQDFYKGDFEAANLRTKYIEEKDYFGYNAYCVYIGGDYPIVQHRNYKDVSDLRVLIVKDSYSLPVQAYLSTMVKELDVIDPRHLKECSVAEYIRRSAPDVVLVLMSPSSFGNSSYQSFGVEEAREMTEPELSSLWKKDIEIEKSDSQNKQDSSVTVENGKTYTIRFSDVEFTDGAAEGVVVTLYNKTTKKNLYSGVMDLAYEREQGEFAWTFTTPTGSDQLCLRLYAGVPGATKGNGVIYRDVELLEWKYSADELERLSPDERR